MSDVIAALAAISLGAKIVWFVAMNFIAYVLMFWDKWQARSDGWRVSEATLLMWASFGGAFGAKAGQRAFRHKTRKEPFRSKLNLAFVASILFCGLVFGAGFIEGVLI